MTVTAKQPARRDTRRGPFAVATVGIIAVALAVAVAELGAALGSWLGPLGLAASPLGSLGAAFIDLTPGWLKDFAVRTFGQHDKDALRAGMGIVLVLVAAGIGLLSRRRRPWAYGLYVGLVGLALAAVATRPGFRVWDVIPTLVGALAGWWFLAAATRAERPDGAAVAETADPAPTLKRRDFVRLTVFGAAMAVGAGALSRWVPNSAAVLASRKHVALPAPVSAEAVPAGAALQVPGLTPFITPAGGFYRVDTAFVLPRVTTGEWRLRVHGLVARPVEIDYADLLAMPLVERMITLTCVSNEVGGNLAGNATWLGARIQDLLAKAGPAAGADCVLSTSADGFTVTTPLAALTDGRDALLAVAMNGQPLPVEHGFPVRMVVPGLYGYVSATKWVVDLQVTKFSQVSAFWTDRGWSAEGPIKTASRIDTPGGRVAAGPVAVAGVAWAQHRGISAVQVQVDDGPWHAARLSAPVGVDTWRQWVYRWDATPGAHTLRCRAVDGTGAVQTSAFAPPAPDGATGLDSRAVTVA